MTLGKFPYMVSKMEFQIIRVLSKALTQFLCHFAQIIEEKHIGALKADRPHPRNYPHTPTDH